MKEIFTLILFIFSQFSFAQNLVPNPSFEDTVICPLSANEVDRATYWTSFRDSPEYFNYCSNQQGGIVGIPNNFLGFQYPHSGDAYAGLIPYDLTGAPYREYIGVQLLTPTIIGQKYFVSFYISRVGETGSFAINKLGITLTKFLYSQSNPYPITNNPKAYSDSIYSDTANWSRIQLSFIADSTYNYLILGNFFDDANTDTINYGQATFAYYYIDDVCLSTDSVYCSNVTAIPINSYSNQNTIEQCIIKDDMITIYFIPSIFEKEIFIYSVLGRLVYYRKTKEKQIDCFFSPFSKSLFIIKCISNHTIQTKKIITN